MTPRVVPLLFVAAALAGPLVAQAQRAVTVGRPVTDSLTARDPVRRSVRAPYHVWRLEGRRGQRLVLDLVSADFDAYLVVRDPDGYTLGSDDDSGDELDARLRVILGRDGVYRVITTAVGDSARGRYTLTVSGWEAPPGPPAGAAAALAIGDTKDGILEPGDDLSPDGPYQDTWTFSGSNSAPPTSTATWPCSAPTGR
jgi:hypothetical protein